MNEELEARITPSMATLLTRIAKVVAHSRLASALIEATLDQTVDTFQATAATIFLADNAARRLRLVGHRNVPAPALSILSDVSFDSSLAVGLVARTLEIQIFTSADLATVEHAALRMALDGRSVVAVPLLAADQLVGVAAYVLPAGYLFSGDELTAFEAIASIIGTGLANAIAQERLESARHQPAR